MEKLAATIIILFVSAGEVNAGRKLKNCKLENTALQRKVDALTKDIISCNATVKKCEEDTCVMKTGCPIKRGLFAELRGTHYLLGTKKSSWFSARDDCHKCGYRLARIESKAEQDFIKQWLKEDFAKNCTEIWCRQVWLDGTDQMKEGCWLYTTEPIAAVSNGYTSWIVNQPSNVAGIEHCLTITLNQNNNWNDADCIQEVPYLCERTGQEEGPLPDLEDVLESGLC